MTLAARTRLGPYEIEAPLGAGGMGEVYKGRDTRLDRTVALKVLPQHVASDPDLKARFEREARTLAALSHPHICPVYDVGEADVPDAQRRAPGAVKVRFLVMEYLDGETLAQRLTKGPLPLEQALKCAIEIADALDKAHRQGIVHRDLKPGNVMLTKSGAKLLDFGLAKLRSASVVPGFSPAAAATGSPTLSSPLTGAGTVLGTLQYMAPERLEGRDADARTDIFAFGAVVYEMVTGRKAFDGQSQASVIAAILERDPPPLSSLVPMAPPVLDRLVRRCLAKDPDDRWQTARDLWHELRWLADERTEASRRPTTASEAGHGLPAGTARGKRTRTAVVAGLVGLLVLISAGVFVRSRIGSDLPVSRTTHFPLALPPGVILHHDMENPGVAISPDGRRLVYGGVSEGQRLYLQDLDRFGPAEPIAGTEGALNPFFSSDGRSIAFVAGNKLQRLDLGGARPAVLADASAFRGGAWSPDDQTIYFSPSLQGGIWKVPSRGGEATPVTTPDLDGFDNTHWWPQVLPGGDRLLYTSCCAGQRIVVFDIATGSRKTVLEHGFFARYVPTGHLVFAQGRSLFAARFDPGTLVVGTPVKILESIVTGHERHAQFAISDTGAFAWFDGTSDLERTLVRRDRSGTMQRLGRSPRAYSLIMTFRPGGQQIAVRLWDEQSDVFVYDLLRDDFDRITHDPVNDFHPVWTPDGRELFFTSIRKDQLDLFVSPADRSRAPEAFYVSNHPKWAHSWSRSGMFLAFNELHPNTGFDIWIYSKRDRTAQPFRSGSFNEELPRFSPDDRWIAYQSDELGQSEIYVVPYPGPGPTCKVSSSGGAEPRWSEDGRELFYRQGSGAMVVDVADSSFCNATPRLLFDGLEQWSWDVSPEGDFFVTLEPRQPPTLHVALDWFEALRRLAPSW